MKFKRFLSVFIVLCICVSMFTTVASAATVDGAVSAPAYPTATVTKCETADLPTNVTLYALDGQGTAQPTAEKVSKLGAAYTFTADEVSDETYNYYKDWRCDFVVSFNQDIEAGTFGLYGKYGDYEIAFVYPKEIHAGDTINLVESAGLDSGLTYADVKDMVKTFTCGAFNLDSANSKVGKLMTVSLSIWQDGNQAATRQAIATRNYGFGDLAKIVRPELPTATVTKCETADLPTNVALYALDEQGTAQPTAEKVSKLGAAYTFTANDVSDETYNYYKDWRCDFVVSFNQDIEAGTFGLYGKYGDYEIAFVYPKEIHAGDTINLVESAGLDARLTYADVKDMVKTFTCGAFNLDGANSKVGKLMTVSLSIWQDGNQAATRQSIATRNYGFGDLAKIVRPELPTATVTKVTDLPTNVALYALDAQGTAQPTAEKVSKLGAAYTFTANEVSDETYNYYKDWRCDYVVTFEDDVPANSFGLYGKYGNYEIAFVYPKEIHAGDTINLVESAGLDSGLTYADVKDMVKTFTCGAFNLDEANHAKTMRVNLVIWKDGEQEETAEKLTNNVYNFGDTAKILPPDAPTATVVEIAAPADVPLYAFDAQGKLQPTDEKVDKLGAAYTFTADEVTPEIYDYYKDWRCDFVVSFDKDIPANTFGLYGKYGDYEIAFVYPKEIHAGDKINLVESAGLDSGLTYADVKDMVKTFTCGAFNLDEANKDAVMTVELAVWKNGEQETTTQKLARETYGFDDLAKIIGPEQPKAIVTKTAPVENAPVYVMKDVTDPRSIVKTGSVAEIQEVYIFDVDPEESAVTSDYYKDYLCDFKITANLDLRANTFGLYGSYGDYDIAFVYPYDVHVGESIFLLDLLNVGDWPYKDIKTLVQQFKCGAFNLSEENLNVGKLMDVDLVMWAPEADPADETALLNAAHETYDFGDLTVINATISASARDAGGNPVAATVSGGGDYNVGAGVTLTANPAAGYSFIGWYKDGERVSTDAAYTFTALTDAEYTAVYEPAGKGILTVAADGFSIAFSGGQATETGGTQNYDKPIGTSVVLNYTGDDFLYWMNASNNIVSREKTYSFVLVDTTYLYAVSSGDLEQDTPTAFLVFHNAYNQIIAQARCDEVSVEEVFPLSTPGKMGAVFRRWIIEDTGEEVSADSYDAILDKLSDQENVTIHIVPEYETSGDTYTVRVAIKDGADITTVHEITTAVGEPTIISKSKVANWSEGAYTAEQFGFFSIDSGATAISYGDDYTAISAVAGTEITVTVVVGDEVQPTFVLTIAQVYASENGEKYRVSPTMKYYVPDGCTVREAGFVYSYATSDPEKLVLENVGNDRVKKHLSGLTDPEVTYTMNINTSYADRVFNIRAFLIYQDAEGNILTEYTPVTAASYQALQ